MRFYVYGHFDKSGQCRYIGKGKAKRAWSFCQRSKRWAKLFASEKPTVRLLEENLSEIEAFEKESFYIAKYLSEGCDLTNIASGGPGGNSWDGRASKMLSEDRTGEGSYWYGKKRDPEMIERMKQTKRLNPQEPYWTGKKRDPEHMKLLVEKAHTQEAKAKAHQTKLQNGSYEWSDERRKSVSGKLTGRDRGPEFAAKVSAAKKGKPNGRLGSKVSEESKAKMSKAAMGRLLSEESQQKRLATWKARGSTSRKAKKVRCIETGEVFRSSKEAAEALTDGKGMKVIQQCCVGSKPSYRGFRWEHVKEV